MAHAGNCSLDVWRVTFSTQCDALSNRTIGDNENENASSSPSINWSLRATESFLRDSESLDTKSKALKLVSPRLRCGPNQQQPSPQSFAQPTVDR